MIRSLAVCMSLLVGVVFIAPAQRPVYRVGPGQRFAELHQIPQLAAGVKVEILYRPTPYRSKLQIGASRVQIVGIAGPNGELPEINGDGAIEAPWSKYWSVQVSDKGVLTVAPSVSGQKVVGTRIEGLKLTGARNGQAGFKNAAGQGAEWSTAAAGIALYRASQTTITGCEIFENNNGIFGTTDGGGGIVEDAVVSGNRIHTNGVPGSFHYHNTYIEGLRTIYQFNTYGSPKSGSAGANLKDRSAGALIRYNLFEGAARILDLVDPETGGPKFVETAEWKGGDYVYGNVIYNPHATTPIHFGYDGQVKYSRHTLYWYYNTAVNVNTQQGGRWRTIWFKTEGVPKINVANSIFHNWSPVPGQSPGEMWLLTEEYNTGTKMDLKANWFTDHTQAVYAAGGPSKAELVGWGQQFKAADPRFMNIATKDVLLRGDSPCRRKAMRLGQTGWPLAQNVPSHTFDPATKTWPDRTSLRNLGACEFAPKPDVQPVPDRIRPLASPLRKGGPRGCALHTPLPEDSINELLAAWKAEFQGDWWPWGLQAVDVDGDGDPELVVTQHTGGGSRVLKQTDSGWKWLNVGSSLGGTFRPYVLNPNGDLLFRDSPQNTAFINVDGQYKPAGFGYGIGNDAVRDITQAYFGHDWGRWSLPGFNFMPYTNPAYFRLPDDIRAYIDANRGKQFFRAWFHTHPDTVAVSGFWSYKNGLPYCRFLMDRRGRLIEGNHRLGLPTQGAVVYSQDFNFDGKPDYLITGAGFYLSGPQQYQRVGGDLSNFLAVAENWPHQVFFSEPHMIVGNVRGETVKIFQRVGAGQFSLQETLWGWDGECVALADLDGNGVDDICVGTGGRNGASIDVIYR